MKAFYVAGEPYIDLLRQLAISHLIKVDPEVFVPSSQAAHEGLCKVIRNVMWEDGYYHPERFMVIRNMLGMLIKKAHMLKLKYQLEDVAQGNNLGPSVLACLLKDQLMDVMVLVGLSTEVLSKPDQVRPEVM